jgi:hypothetical protein
MRQGNGGDLFIEVPDCLTPASQKHEELPEQFGDLLIYTEDDEARQQQFDLCQASL